MSWIRDNILKLAIILVIAIIAIVLVSIFAGKKSEPNVETGDGYQELEKKMYDAAIKYAGDHADILPKTKDKDLNVKLRTLVEGNYIGELHAIEDKNVVCTGNVKITLLDLDTNDYDFIPHLECGKYYETQSIKEKIINNQVVTTGDGLYKQGDEYVFKGDYPNNYIKLGDGTYRILSITKDGDLKLLSTFSTSVRYIWDNRYNSEVGTYVGFNNYTISRMKDNLEFLYTNTTQEDGEIIFVENEKKYFKEHDFCIGKINPNDTNYNIAGECAETYTYYVGLMNISDYYRASISAECSGPNDLDCNNYNYLFKKGPYVTMNADSTTSYKYIRIDDGVLNTIEANNGDSLYMTVYIDGNNSYLSGEGSEKDPYVLR